MSCPSCGDHQLMDPHLYVPNLPADHAVDGPLYHERLLGQALGEVIYALGITTPQPLTAPQLLLFAQDAVDGLRAKALPPS